MVKENLWLLWKSQTTKLIPFEMKRARGDISLQMRRSLAFARQKYYPWRRIGQRAVNLSCKEVCVWRLKKVSEGSEGESLSHFLWCAVLALGG